MQLLNLALHAPPPTSSAELPVNVQLFRVDMSASKAAPAPPPLLAELPLNMQWSRLLLDAPPADSFAELPVSLQLSSTL
jgi:hypothetical protein